MKKNARTLDRRVGEGAASLQSYHDDPYRRANYHWGRRTLEYGQTCEFVNPKATETLNHACVFGVLYNPIAQYPHKIHKDFMPYRDEAQYVVVSAHKKETLRKHIEYLYKNFDSLVITDNCIDLDLDVMGIERTDLYDFIAKRSTKKGAQDLKENQELLSKALTYMSPKNQSKKSVDDNGNNDEEEDVGNLDNWLK